jgi:ankyrin repeat protein
MARLQNVDAGTGTKQGSQYMEFKHLPIDLEGPSIRLLRLSRGTFGRPVGELFFVSLEAEVPYEALSYTWGDPTRFQKITINGKAMEVTENLFAALKYVRQEDADRVLWIDAICIDQTNQKERGHQVQQMGDIYKHAEKVIVWLGHGTVDTDVAMDIIGQLHSLVVRRGHSLESWNHYSDSLSSTLKNRMLAGVLDLLKRPWFRRVWVLQEVANARVATIVCGDKAVSARTFGLVPSFLGMTLDPHIQAVLEVMPGVLRRESWYSTKPTLYTLLLKFRDSQASQPRDKIFALLGMSSDACTSSLVIPDYTKTEKQLIRDTVLFILTSSTSNQTPALFDLNRSDFLFLEWDLSDFMRQLQDLQVAVFMLAWDRNRPLAAKMLLKASQSEMESYGVEDAWILLWAIQNNHHDLAKVVIERTKDNVVINTRHIDQMSPLAYAARKGQTEMVKLLLATDKINVDSEDIHNRTPLSYASQGRHHDIVKQLLATGLVDANAKDKYGKTPIWYASDQKTINLLLDTGKIGAHAIDRVGRTLLSHTAEGPDEEQVVHLLLATTKVDFDVDLKDIHGRTPLSYAAEKGRETTVKLLLGTNKVNVNSKSDTQTTPLMYAIENGHTGVVKLLLASDEIAMYCQSVDLKTPLISAINNGRAEVVELLLASKEIDINYRTADLRTPLIYAIEKGYTEIAKTLLALEKIDINCQTADLRTPLIYAIDKRNTEVVKLLLAFDQTNVNCQTALLRTPLMCASLVRSEEIVKLLLATGKINFKFPGVFLGSPLRHAVTSGQDGIVRALLATNQVSRFEIDLVLRIYGINKSPFYKWLILAREGKILREDVQNQTLLEVSTKGCPDEEGIDT